MNYASYIDATILNPKSTTEDYKKLALDAIHFSFPAICVAPYQIVYCKNIIKSSGTKLATVVGFPAGYQTIADKINELRNLIQLGADELDYVIHRGLLADKKFEEIEEELFVANNLCKESERELKWIIEASEIEEVDLLSLLHIANRIKPKYVKTSTGVYGKADLDQVALMRKMLLPEIHIKAAGGISDKATSKSFIEAGASRLGISNYKALVEE